MGQLLRKWMEGLKIVAPIILLSIILPTWDVFSDLRIIIMIFMEEFATCLQRWWEIAQPWESSRRSYEYKSCLMNDHYKKFNCTLWAQCWLLRLNSSKTEAKNYCKLHPEACAFHKDFGTMLLGILYLCFRFWWLILQYRSFLLTLKIPTHGGLKHPTRNRHSCYPYWIYTHSLVGFMD